MKKFAEPKDEAKWSKDKKKKNVQRLGGGRGGLSLEAFANAKTKSNTYNPAIIKKQREFYKNAKCVSKYKKIVKQQGEQLEPSDGARQHKDEEIGKADKVDKKNKNQKNNARSLRELYERKREEEEKSRMERDAIILAKKEERQKAESRRKALREKMLKKTRSGQPVMKYRIEHILETLQGSKS
ncbi:hypothetical protein K7X08_003345 [Anisodus acutangulus]|uniref:Thyroid transcription factor 1-associated protein 26 n=1 Tax=Anisodus acutangulus TaxID=402998 RepID=A0A9Q1RIQ0_9SOLA|nr:hypothetical protein K7X08_003345 [Anisodus acutangulus]